MITAWRICNKQHASSSFSGEGAVRSGGRWNSKGTRIAYSSASPSLAVLELLVNLKEFNSALDVEYVMVSTTFDVALIESLSADQLPHDWSQSIAPESLKVMGDAWAKSQRSLVLQVPSAVMTLEPNYLINPEHPDFAKLVFSEPIDYQFDPRLFPIFTAPGTSA